MEKLKNLVNPGSKKDDEVMYGSGRSDDPVHSGQGSHFGTSRTADSNPVSSSTNPTTGLGHNAGKDPLTTSSNPTGTSQYDTDRTGRGTAGLNEPYASRMPGGFDDDAATTASVRSGIPGQTTQTGSGMTGSHDPNLTNKPLPREPGSGLTDSPSHHASEGNTLTGQTYPDRSVGSSGLGNDSTGPSHLGRDAAIGAGTAAHHHHENTQRDNYAPETGRSFPLGGSSNTTSGSNYPSGQSGTYPAGGPTSSTAGPHSSNLANKADPRIDSDLDRSRAATSSNYPSGHSGVNPIGGSSSTTAGPHSSNLANKADPRIDSDLDGSRNIGNAGYGSTTGTTPSSTNHGSLGRDTAIGAGSGIAARGIGSSPSGYGPESWEHEHNRHGHQYEGDPCGPGESTAAGPHFVEGPHATDTANRLDPHVAGGSGPTETTTGPHHNHGRGETGLAGGVPSSGLGAYEGSRGQQGITPSETDRSGLGSSSMGTADSSTGSSSKPVGPHKSDMLNKLDPRVDSDLSKQQASKGTGLGAITTGASDPYSTQAGHRDHPRGEGVAVGGTGLAGAAAYEGTKHHGNQPTGTDLNSSQYSRSGFDPRVDSDRSGLGQTTSPASGTGKDHHLGRDAALGAGAGGLAYEAERHHGKPTHSSAAPSNIGGNDYDTTRGPVGHDPAGSQISGSGSQPVATREHHFGRDAALGAGVGGAAYEAEKHHGRDPSGVASTPQDQLAGSGHQPQSQQSGHHHMGGLLGNRHAADQSQPGVDDNTYAKSGRDHHLGRDMAVGGAGLGAAAAGVDQHDKFQRTGHADPGTTVREQQHPGASVATYPSPGYGNDRTHQDPNQHGHRREEEALAGGAAAGGLAHHDHSKKDEKALEKEHAKEIKQHDKALEKEHAKEVKQHDKAFEKEHAKEVKQHDKEVAKEEKAIEKDEKHHEKERAKHLAAIEKDRKKHEHEQEHDHQGEKKKGGLLGFLHRDKSDKELKEEEARRQRAIQEDNDEFAGAGTGSYADPLAAEHGSQSGVHDRPLGTGPTTHDAYGTQEGHNKLHKDPPSNVLEARGQGQQGHGNVS